MAEKVVRNGNTGNASQQEDPKDKAVDAELEARIRERRKNVASAQRRKKRRTILLIVLAFALLATMCGRDIVRLKAENRALKKQHAALEKERDELKEELKSTSDQEYIRDQARKQLRLLNPGEILFTFDDEEDHAGKGEEDEQQ